MKLVIRLILSLFLVLLTIEGAARIDDFVSYGASPFKNFNQDSLFEFDQNGQRGKPYAKYFKWELNGLGFRGPDLVPSSVRIGAVGSSETFGLYESQGKEWPQALEQLYNSKSQTANIQVVNFAYAGMLLSTFEKRLAEYVALTSPQKLLIYPSLVGYLYRNIKDPLAAEKSSPAQEPLFEIRLTSRLSELLKRIMPQTIREIILQWQLGRAIAASTNHYDRVPEEYVNVFRSDLERVLTKLLEKSVEPVLITHATFFGDAVQDNDKFVITAWRKFYPMLEEQGFLDMEKRFNQVIREIAQARNITLVDLAKDMPAGSEYFADAVHFTDKGAALAAQKIFEVLNAKN